MTVLDLQGCVNGKESEIEEYEGGDVDRGVRKGKMLIQMWRSFVL